MSIQEMRAMLHHNAAQDKLNGQIDLKLYNKHTKSNKAAVIKDFRKDFNVPNYKIGKLIEDVDIDYHPEILNGSLQVYTLEPQRNNLLNYELWVSLSESRGYHYLAVLITPSREEEFYTWARNSETFKLVVSSIRVSNKAEKQLSDFME